jgi:hypothetical protein
MVIATGKPAAIRAGFSKAVPQSPAARGRAATATIWPRREKALLTADAIPECREPALASTTAVIGVISAARPAPEHRQRGQHAREVPVAGVDLGHQQQSRAGQDGPVASGIRGPVRCATAPEGRDRISISAVTGSAAAPA